MRRLVSSRHMTNLNHIYNKFKLLEKKKKRTPGKMPSTFFFSHCYKQMDKFTSHKQGCFSEVNNYFDKVLTIFASQDLQIHQQYLPFFMNSKFILKLDHSYSLFLSAVTSYNQHKMIYVSYKNYLTYRNAQTKSLAMNQSRP